MNETLETMWKRRSIRKYKSDPIPDKDLNLIFEAARRAPTGGNRQKSAFASSLCSCTIYRA